MQNEVSGNLFSIIKGGCVSLLSSLVLTGIFALVLRFSTIPSSAIYPTNQILKTVAVAIGAFASVRGERGWLKGGAVGLLFTMLSYLAFSAIGGDFSLSWLIFAELALGAFSGALCGIIAVNLKRS